MKLIDLIKEKLDLYRKNEYSKFYGNLPQQILTYVSLHSHMDVKLFGMHRDKRLKVIINPHGGNGKAVDDFYNNGYTILKKSNIFCEIIVTDYPGNGYTLGYEHNPIDYEGVILVGGDGLVNEFVNGIMLRKDAAIILSLTPICILPSGSQNGLAQGIGTGNYYTALYSVIKRKLRHLDAIEVLPGDGSKVYCVSGTAWGIASDMVMDYENTRNYGLFRYPYLKAKWGFFNRTKHKASLYYVLLIMNNSYQVIQMMIMMIYHVIEYIQVVFNV